MLVVLPLVSCDSGKGPVYVDAQDLASEVGPGIDDAAGYAEIGAPDWVEPDEIAVQGAFGFPCYADDECLSGLCVESTQAFVCTEGCDEGGCPDGWLCSAPTAPGHEGTFCMPRHGTLCRPCEADSDCVTSDAVDASCADYDGHGRFCATSCELHEDCPEGFICRVEDLPDGTTRSLCMREEGSCACAKKYGALELPTACYHETAAGICHGQRVCSLGVLSACDAPVPVPESCNGLDDDCDGLVDEQGAEGCQALYPDGDGDGYGVGTASLQCLCEGVGSSVAGDCDDGSATVHPGAAEVCNGIDDNCNGFVDEGVEETFYLDSDGDGFGMAGVTVVACEAPEGYVELGSDCVDFNADIYPGAPEICNDLDDDCNGIVDEGLELIAFHADNDNDGHGSKAGLTLSKCLYPDGSGPPGWAPSADDCSDYDATVHPGAPALCDGKDNNCDGLVDRLCFTPCEGNWPFQPTYVSESPATAISDLDGDGQYEIFYNSGIHVSFLNSKGVPLYEHADPESNFLLRGQPRFADIDDYDDFALSRQTLEVLTTHEGRSQVYRLNDTGGFDVLYDPATANCGGGTILVTDLEYDGPVEIFTHGCCDPVFWMHRYDAAAESLDLVFTGTDPQGKCSRGLGRLISDLDGDGMAEYMAGNGWRNGAHEKYWGGYINLFEFVGSPVEGIVATCPGPECFDAAIPDLYGAEISSLVQVGGTILARAIYFDTPQFVSYYDALDYVWRYALDGTPSAESPVLADPYLGETDADDDGILDLIPERAGGTLYDANGDGYPDIVRENETVLEVLLWDVEAKGWVANGGSTLPVNGQKLRRGGLWDIDADDRLEILFADEAGALHCYQLGVGTWNPYGSLPELQSTHYPTFNSDPFEPNDGFDEDGDGLPDRVRRVPSAMTAQGNFYALLATPGDEDFYVVDTQWSTKICLRSPPNRVYNLAVYSFQDKWNNQTHAAAKDGKVDGLVWSDDSDASEKCFTSAMVTPPRWGEYKFAIKVWSDGDYSPYWPYWLHIPK